MKKLIEEFRGGVAFGMTMPGPRPVFSPPDDDGKGDDEGGDDGGGDDKAGGDDKGNEGQKQEGEKKAGDPKLKGGLFGQRKAGDGNDDGGDDKAGDKDADGRPKGLADKFWNAKDKTINVDAITKAYADLEKAHGELKRARGPGGGEVPEKPEQYFADGVAVPEEASNFRGLDADDPGVKAWAAVCKQRGIGKDLARDLMSDMLVTMNDHAQAPIDPEEEMKSLGKGGPALVDGVFVWADGMAQAGDLSEDDVEVIEQIASTAKGIRLLAKFRNMTGEKPIPVNPGNGVRGMSMDQLDEAYKKAVKEKNYAEQERLDALRNEVNPEGTAPGISGRAGGYSI